MNGWVVGFCVLVSFIVIGVTTCISASVWEAPGDHFVVVGVAVGALQLFAVIAQVSPGMGIIGGIPVLSAMTRITLHRGDKVVVVFSSGGITVVAGRKCA